MPDHTCIILLSIVSGSECRTNNNKMNFKSAIYFGIPYALSVVQLESRTMLFSKALCPAADLVSEFYLAFLCSDARTHRVRVVRQQ